MQLAVEGQRTKKNTSGHEPITCKRSRPSLSNAKVSHPWTWSPTLLHSPISKRQNTGNWIVWETHLHTWSIQIRMWAWTWMCVCVCGQCFAIRSGCQLKTKGWDCKRLRWRPRLCPAIPCRSKIVAYGWNRSPTMLFRYLNCQPKLTKKLSNQSFQRNG